VNALANAKVADYLNENFICTYLKVGTFQIIDGQKVGGNVASYFCLADSSVVHAVPGKVDANKLINEARWAYEVRKSALTFSTDLGGAKLEPDMRKYVARIKQSHTERYFAEANGQWLGGGRQSLPGAMPRNITQQGQAHWLLAKTPLPRLETVYPTVWTQVLGERLSALPVAKN
jgi:hypothetical protein